MSDITMCSGVGCVVRSVCYRHTATQDSRNQSWFSEIPGGDDNCPEYWPTENDSEQDAES